MSTEMFEDVLKSYKYVRARAARVRELAKHEWAGVRDCLAKSLAEDDVRNAESVVAEGLRILLKAGRDSAKWSSPEELQNFVKATFHYAVLNDKHPPPYGDPGLVYYGLRSYIKCLGY